MAGLRSSFPAAALSFIAAAAAPMSASSSSYTVRYRWLGPSAAGSTSSYRATPLIDGTAARTCGMCVVRYHSSNSASCSGETGLDQARKTPLAIRVPPTIRYQTFVLTVTGSDDTGKG